MLVKIFEDTRVWSRFSITTHIVYVLGEEAVVKKHQVLLDGRPGARVRRISRIHPIAEKRDKRAGYKFGRFSFLLSLSVGLLHSKREPRATPSVSVLKIVKEPGCAHADRVPAWRGSNKFLIQVGDPKNAARGHTPWNGRREIGGQTSNWSAKICFDSHGFFRGRGKKTMDGENLRADHQRDRTLENLRRHRIGIDFLNDRICFVSITTGIGGSIKRN